MLEAGWQRTRARLLECRAEEKVRGRSPEAAADHDLLRLEDVHEVRDADTEPASQVGEVALRIGVAGARGCLDVAALHARRTLERAPRAGGLDAAVVRAGPPRALEPVGLDDHVPELCAQPGRPAEDAAVDDPSASDPGAECQHQEVARGAAVDQLRFGE